MKDIGSADHIPLAGNVVSVALSMTTIAVLASCLTRRLGSIASWTALPFPSWLILAIYIDSSLFVLATAIISQGLDINVSQHMCDGAILLCLVCYLTTKVMIYFFLVEKAFIIRGGRRSRFKDRLYLFNFFGMIVPYLVVIVMNFVYRFAYINDNGVCIIGMQKISMIPLITFDVVVNIYLTMLFLLPLRKLYSYQHNKNNSLRKMALRTFIGSCATLTSSVVNLTILMVLKGEQGWICLMCCNVDILFSVVVLHWVTAIDTNRAPASYGPRPTNPGSSNRKSGVEPKWTGRISGGNVGIVTTSCIAETRGGSSDLEIDKIKVQTEQTQEIEVDARSDMTMDTGRPYRGFPGRDNSTEQMV